MITHIFLSLHSFLFISLTFFFFIKKIPNSTKNQKMSLNLKFFRYVLEICCLKCKNRLQFQIFVTIKIENHNVCFLLKFTEIKSILIILTKILHGVTQ